MTYYFSLVCGLANLSLSLAGLAWAHSCSSIQPGQAIPKQMVPVVVQSTCSSRFDGQVSSLRVVGGQAPRARRWGAQAHALTHLGIQMDNAFSYPEGVPSLFHERNTILKDGNGHFKKGYSFIPQLFSR